MTTMISQPIFPRYNSSSEFIIVMHDHIGRMITVNDHTSVLTYDSELYTYCGASINDWDSDFCYTGGDRDHFSDIVAIYYASNSNILSLCSTYDENDILWERVQESEPEPKEIVDAFEETPEDTYLRYYTY